MPPSPPPATPFSHLSVEEGYTLFLTQWVACSQAQLRALQTTDWNAFEEALHAKDRLIEGWEAYRKEHPLESLDVAPAVRERWQALAREAETLDQQIEDILHRLRQEVQDEVHKFQQERRALRSYFSRLRHLSPRYLDKQL